MAAAAIPTASTTEAAAEARVARLHHFLLGPLVFLGAFVIIDIPYNVAFILAALAMAFGGWRISAPMTPMFVLTLVYIAGGLASLSQNFEAFVSNRYMVTIFFLACTCFYFAAILQEHTRRRLEIVRNATIVSAIIACFIGLLGFFDVAGLGAYLRVYEGRASGPFRDPNVFGSFLALPAMYLMQDILLGEKRGQWWRIIAFMLVALLVFLSFSRGSWVVLAVASIMLVALTLATEPAMRRRVAGMTVAAFVGFLLLLIALLSVDDIYAVFEQRARLLQSYDEGRTGRFGKILHSLGMLLESPNGLGPLRYYLYFFEDPHNVYVNGFANFGWVGGLAYLGLIVATCVVGFRMCFQNSPWRRETVAIWCALFTQILQGVQIDTNTWRHFNMMIGLIWGIGAAWAMMQRRAAARAQVSAPVAPVQAATIPASAFIAAR